MISDAWTLPTAQIAIEAAAILAFAVSGLIEAARIDGAGPWARFIHVTLPGVAPSLWMVAIMTMAAYVQIFAEPYVMTQGGPAQSTVSLLYFMYEQGFKWWNLGTASATAFILFVIMLILTALRPKSEEAAL